MRRSPPILISLMAGLLFEACTAEPKSNPFSTGPVVTDADSFNVVNASTPGSPIRGLTPRQRQAFNRGMLVFSTPFTPATGLGPLFNASSCLECHEQPSIGGHGDEVEVHVSGTFHPGSSCPSLEAVGGPVVQQHVTPELAAALGITVEPTPPGATETGFRSAVPLFGLGLLDAVSDRTIQYLASIRYPDGVHGRAAVLPNGQVGRFGRKATVASLTEFNAGAFFNEMGVTNRLNPIEGTVAGMALPAGVDLAADPEIDDSSLAAADAFVHLLAPPAGQPLTELERHGRELFHDIRCTSCHIPILPTGRSSVDALRFKLVRVYSDLLLHDMGPQEADICNGVAGPSDFRTQPLMGTQYLDVFMHDGKAASIEEAIQRHGGEAAAARDRFSGLVKSDQAALVAFVHSL
jgi:CxxC motif-containing protein (DUF1111 family)